MKKFIILLFILCSLLALSACKSGSDSSYSSSSSSSSVDVEAMVKREALSMIYEAMEREEYSTYRDYDIGATKYSFGSIKKAGARYTANGTLYLYNKYGNLEDTAVFSVDVEVSGGSCRGYLPKIKIG